MVDISNIQTEGEQVESTRRIEQDYEEADFDAFGEFWERTSKEMTERVENHEFESSPFQSNIPGNRKEEGYKSQVNRDFADTLEMLPDEDTRFIHTVEAVAHGRELKPQFADEEQLNMEYVNTAAEKYLRANPGQAFSPIQIAEDITPRDSVITRAASRAALRSIEPPVGHRTMKTRVGELTDLANNDDVVDYHSDEEERSINDMVMEEPHKNGNGVGFSRRGGWLDSLDEQQAERQSVWVDEAVEYLAEENPEAMNEIAIKYVAEKIQAELDRKVEFVNEKDGEWIDRYDRGTLEEAGVIGEEEYEVRGETFYVMSEAHMEFIRSNETFKPDFLESNV